MALPSITSTAPSVYVTYPPKSLFQFPPASDPQALNPEQSPRTLARPFTIDPDFYNTALNVEVPATIALTYAVTVFYLNKLNKERNYKPWAFSKSLAFYVLVIVHNVSLAVFSGWTFIGMFNTIRHSWPGWKGEHGVAGAVDALCKMNGPRGLGSAATFNSDLIEWKYTDKTIKLVGGHPDPTDVGRIWNEGLAFYGWLFYMSKFYEVLDTAIILAKGKRSGGLQTYHHAGAMLCMWAGIRFMSPPIWMFVFINSGLHTLMYTYYTLAALTIQVPKSMKKLLTRLQIAQIVIGCTYALAHLFVSYDIPIELPYTYVRNLLTALPSTASSLSSAASSSFSSVTATAGIANWLKKAALRAAGEEGLAENVRNNDGETFGIDAVHALDAEKAHEETRYRMGTQRIHCIDTSGQVFAILLNASYLIPLLALFLRFFYKSYNSRIHSEHSKPNQQEVIKRSSEEAYKSVKEEIDTDEQGGPTEPPPDTKVKLEQSKADIKDSTSNVSANVQAEAKDLGEKAKERANDLNDKTGDVPAKVQQSAQNLSNKAQEGIEKVKEIANDIPTKASDMGEQAQRTGIDVKGYLKDDLQALQDKMKKVGGEGTKFKGKENNQPNGDTKSRDKSPEKAAKPREKSPEKKLSASRDRSPEKTLPASRDKSPQKQAPSLREKSPQKKASIPRNPSPEKKAPVPRDPSPVKAPEPSVDCKEEPNQEPNKEPESPEEKKSSPDLGASGYEMVPDEPKTEEERKAEAEMQPNQEVD
ncbi:hypothetical protein ACLMJK_002402 [Lecanora helva]